MPIHDAYGRRSPYELLMPDASFPERHFPGIEGEARERGSDPWNPAAFVMLGTVQGALEEIRPDDAGPEAIHDHGGVLYHVYHMWRSEAALTLVRAATVRELLAPKDFSTPEWAPFLAGRAGYIQLPQHMVWVEDDQGRTPESLDGAFWAGSPDGILHVAAVTGVRGDRPGYGVVPVPPQPFDTLSEWAVDPAREQGREFESGLPGAELEGLFGVRTPAELLKLVARVLGALALTPERSRQAPGTGGDASPPPTTLPTLSL